MATAALLTTDAILVGYAEVPDGTQDGPIDRELIPDAAGDVAHMRVFQQRPDLPADGSYFWDQTAGASGSFKHERYRRPKVLTSAQALHNEAYRRAAAGERLPDWLLPYLSQG